MMTGSDGQTQRSDWIYGRIRDSSATVNHPLQLDDPVIVIFT